MPFQAIPKISMMSIVDTDEFTRANPKLASGGSIHLTPDLPFTCQNMISGRCTKGFLFCPNTTDNGVPGCYDQDITPQEYDCPDIWILVKQ